MKKLIIITLAAVLLSGCADSWQQDISYLPAEKVEEVHALLDEELVKFKADSSDVDAAFQVAYQYQVLGQYKNAEKYYLKTIELNPGFPTPYNNLAAIYEEVGEYEKAVQYITEYYNLNPPNLTEALSDAVRIFLKNNEPDRAQALLEHYMFKLTPEEKAANHSLISSTYDQIFTYRQQHGKK